MHLHPVPVDATMPSRSDTRGSAARGGFIDRLRERALRDPWLVQLVCFCVVGGVGTVVNLLVFSALNLGVGVGRFQSATIAWLLALLNNYVLNRHFTFASSGRVRVELPRFTIASLLAFAVNLAVLRALAPVDALLAQSLAILAATPVNFIISRLWAFAAPAVARTTAPAP
jgi:putative flippase GtrA